LLAPRWIAAGLGGALLLAIVSCASLLGLADISYSSDDAGTLGTDAGTEGTDGCTAGTDAGASANSCATPGPGTTNCGSSANESCCTSLCVPGGVFLRGYAGVTSSATVSDFRLDEYEITVGRFRQFVDAVTSPAGGMPAPGSGKHSYLADGGLNGGMDPGWDPSWTASLPTTYGAWTQSLTCAAPTWTPMPGLQENLPINCITWFEAYAFCIWDGGFLPSEAEWNYAAAGGGGDSMGQRAYPWSDSPASRIIDCSYANYSPEGGTGCAGSRVNEVGAEAPKGNGRFGQADLAGNAYEWVLDWFVTPYPSPCVDCAVLTTTSTTTNRVFRGGSCKGTAAALLTTSRAVAPPAIRYSDLGARCARSP
jgi:formylglycine-generating enzyme